MARRCHPELLFNKPGSEETKEQVKKDLANWHEGGFSTRRVRSVTPPVKTFTIADFYTFYCFSLADGCSQRTFVGVRAFCSTRSSLDSLENQIETVPGEDRCPIEVVVYNLGAQNW